MPASVKQIHITPSFHYDVAYLKTYAEYLPRCFDIIDEGLRLLEKYPEYRFLIEQVILVEEYWERFPEKRGQMRRFAEEGRLEVAPGMFAMPDMNHPDGESMFLQAKVGKEWLREHMDIEPDVCYIADCWGHHAQLPQILRQAGYGCYAFWRCMRRDVMKNDFIWEGLDGTPIEVHWLARGYGSIHFPDDRELVNAPDLDLAGCSPEQVRELCDRLREYGPSDSLLLPTSGDFMFPQASAPQVVERLDESDILPPVRFSTLSEFAKTVDWENKPIVKGEFNSAFHGTFTSNVRIKQRSRQLVNRLLSLEALAVVAGKEADGCAAAWRLLLKQQFHDIICGSLTDGALDDSYREFDAAERLIDAGFDELAAEDGAPTVFNPLGFEREEIVDLEGERCRVEVPGLGFGAMEAVERIEAGTPPALPCAFENEFFRAQIGADGHIESLVEKDSGREIAREGVAPFGSLGMQMDYGDLWMRFEAPLSGGSLESSLTQNVPDPVDPAGPSDLVNRNSFRPQLERASVVASSAEEMIVAQEGVLAFWQLQIRFETRVRFARRSPRIEYETKIEPLGKHYRIRALFPTSIRDGLIRHEIPFGIQERSPHEHVAQNWIDYADEDVGLALFNRGTPGNNVDDGTMLLSLFRAAAMEYKAPSAGSFNEGVAHTFQYAIMPHGSDRDVEIVRQGYAFNRPLVITKGGVSEFAQWNVAPDSVFISGLRRSGDTVFIRVYEATGATVKGAIRVPEGFGSYARADGLQRATEEFQRCDGSIPLELRGFEIGNFLLKEEE